MFVHVPCALWGAWVALAGWIFPLIALALTVAGALPALVRLATTSGRSWRIDGRGVPGRAAVLFLLACFYAPAIAWAGLDAATLARMIRTQGIPGIVLDMSNRPQEALRDLAAQMGAPYVPLPRADAKRLSNAISNALDD